MSVNYLATFINVLFQALSLAILASVVMSWIDPMGNLRITQIIREISEPILGPIRSILPNIGMIDFSPIIAFLLLQALHQLIMTALSGR